MMRAIELLKQICSTHEQMLQMATQLQWDQLTAKWPIVEKLLAELKGMPPLTTLAASDSAEAARLIEKILEIQTNITEKVKPWQEQVRPLLDSFKRYPLQSSSETKSAG